MMAKRSGNVKCINRMQMSCCAFIEPGIALITWIMDDGTLDQRRYSIENPGDVKLFLQHVARSAVPKPVWTQWQLADEIYNNDPSSYFNKIEMIVDNPEY